MCLPLDAGDESVDVRTAGFESLLHVGHERGLVEGAAEILIKSPVADAGSICTPARMT